MVDVYNKEKNNGLRMCFRLTEGHLNPNNWQKMTVSKAAQLFSRHVAMAFMHYREKPETSFLDTAPTERMTLLLNDVFDILNGRFPKEGISKTSWPKKKDKLQKMLLILNITEEIVNDPGRDRHQLQDIKVMSDTSLVAWRLVIHSAIGLVEELSSAGLNVVLTGRFNQDLCRISSE